MVKKKKSGSWLVMVGSGDGLNSTLYSGPDRKAARAKAEKALLDNPKQAVTVLRVSRVAVLNAGDLAASLPRDAF